MGLLDLFRPNTREVAETRSALEAAEDPAQDPTAIDRLVRILLDTGLDGVGPLDSAATYAAEAKAKTNDTEAAVNLVARRHLAGGAIGGFATGVGGFATALIAMPVNVLEFYVQATRMVGSIATLRGYDVTDPQVRTAVLLTLVGSHAEEVLAKAGVSTGGGRLGGLLLNRVPASGLMIINKAIGFRLLRGVSEKLLSRLGRGIPLAGGVIGGTIDGFMMKKIADQAMKEFPAKHPMPS